MFLERFLNRVFDCISAPVEPPVAAKTGQSPSTERPVITNLSNFRDAFVPAKKQSGNFEKDIRAAGKELEIALDDLTRVPFNDGQMADINLVRMIIAPVIDIYHKYEVPGGGAYQTFRLYPKDIEGMERAMPALKAARDYYAGMADPKVGRIGKAAIGTADATDALQRVQGVLILCDIFAPPTCAPAVTKKPVLQLVHA